MAKRMLVIADLHCGHQVGLTPPRWHMSVGSVDKTTKREKYRAIQEESWNWYAKEVKTHGPYDVVVVNGDAIDGRGERSGGTELLVTDREEQCDMAVQCIKHAMGRKTKVVMTYGTAYHTGADEDWENDIARRVGAKIGSHEWVKCEGVVFDFKHHVGSGGVPHTRAAAVTREALWSQLWADRALTPKADVLIRSHVHYFCGSFDMGVKPHWRMTTPALQAMGTKYGSRRCSGIVDYGFLVFDCHKGDWSFEEVLFDLKTEKASVLTV